MATQHRPAPSSSDQAASAPDQGLPRAGHIIVGAIIALACGAIALFVFTSWDGPRSHPVPVGDYQSSWPVHYETTEYRKQPLTEILQAQEMLSDNWIRVDSSHSGLGYIDGPATFRLTLENNRLDSVQKWVVSTAPFLDRIRAVQLDQRSGAISQLRTMGDAFTRDQRILDLPFWVWPVTLPPRAKVTLFFEVSNQGPIMLPLSIQSAWELLGASARIITGKSLLLGLMAFALTLNLVVLLIARKMAMAWLTVILLSILHSELVLSGFGLWLVWPQMPWISTLTGLTLPLCLIALCQFARHFLLDDGIGKGLMTLFSTAGAIILAAHFLKLPYPGQGSLLVVAITASLTILTLTAPRLRSSLNARYFALAMLALLSGGLIASLRTIGLLPVNSLTNASFSLGAVAASIILTASLLHLLTLEKRQQRTIRHRINEERSRRTQLESDYRLLLRTHRASGHPNRPALEEALTGIRAGDRPYQVVCIRLTHYHEIERAIGYRYTEELLKNWLGRLEHFLDQQLGCQLIRVDGFAVATLEPATHAFVFHASPESDKEFWSRLEDWLSQAFTTDRFMFRWHPSIGVAHAPEHSDSGPEALSCASYASLNPTAVRTVYDPDQAEQQNNQQLLMQDLDGALARGEIHLVYQPKVRITDRRVMSCEALIRWNHPEIGRVAPSDWIPVAEKLGTIHRVTLWAMRRACQDLPKLRRSHGEELRVSVNISAHDLGEPDFAQKARQTITEQGFSPDDLILELTETAAMTDEAGASKAIRELSEAGFRVALDDFGTGYSSLSALASLELNELKIDRSFLLDITISEARQRVFFTAIELADALGLQVVVEGVETAEVADWLLQFPDLLGQGYYWGKPQAL